MTPEALARAFTESQAERFSDPPAVTQSEAWDSFGLLVVSSDPVVYWGPRVPRVRLHSLPHLCRELTVSSAGRQGHAHLPEPGRGVHPHHALRPLQR